ncbi:MAG: DNRLRE domain-containing protein [Saprospiraceae bacterium]|nr:DNRLRE domain-containing protein [Saprospiraceae bacterium]MCB9323985.1 DNRLRE domain-containing protein [Lewinellaceae bacterium]
MKYGLIFKSWFLFFLLSKGISAQVIPVQIVNEPDGTFQLLRGGEPYWIKGAGTGNPERFAELARRGGNSVRTWGAGSITGELLDSAYYHGLSVMLGLWVGHEADGFNYDNEAAVAAQLEAFQEVVLQYKDHPALLAWGIGNEVNLGYSNLKVWDAVNDISMMIHELDGNHPTLTITAGLSVNLANTIALKANDLDLIGVNSYGGISSVAVNLNDSNWEKPYVMTEWGVNGPWESAHTAWDAPIEPNSTQKASTFQNRYQNAILPNMGKILGSYAFLWNEKNEGTLTWFGLFVGQETTPMVDVLQRMWTDTSAVNLAPEINSVSFSGQALQSSYTLYYSQGNVLEVQASDPDGDDLSYEFIIRPESGEEGVVPASGETFDGIPGIIDYSSGNSATLSFNGSENDREFRVYVLVRDGKGHVATASLPIRTDLVDLQESYEFIPEQDAYIGNGATIGTPFGAVDSENLKVKYSNVEGEHFQTYLLFDLNQAPPVFSSVTLELYGLPDESVELQVWGFGGFYWNEDNISGNNCIIPGSGSLAVFEPQESSYQWFTWEVKEFIEKQFSQNNRNITLVVRGNSAFYGDPVVFESKEGGGAHPPKLVFNTTPANTNMAENSKPEISIFPNPASETLHVELPSQVEGLSECLIFTMEGKLLGSFERSGHDFFIPVSSLPASTYVLLITNREADFHGQRKFIKSEH